MPRPRYSPAFLARMQADEAEALYLATEAADRLPVRRVPALERRYPPGCPDADWCAGNAVCYWDCLGVDEGEPSDGNYFQKIHQSDKGIAERERGWDRGEE